ncbi:MAG: type 1 glutamine amidotransferase [Betaproteobacteria bacterium]|nr:type 1 glutamine amidotransferase [Betaproteobacteria bacterium]
MKPVAVFRHAPTEGPGYFATFLENHRIEWHLVKLDEGEPVPEIAEGFAGLSFMGGPMSANDDLSWTQPVLALIRDAVRRRIPVIGHCLGGQLLSKALGGSVTANPVKEIGWHRVDVEDTPEAREWFGPDLRTFTTFQWHGETFTIPPGGSRILRGEHCANQAYVVAGRHLGMQCHVEMTSDLVRSWCETGAREIAESRDSPAVQGTLAIEGQSGERLPVLADTARRLYGRWIEGLDRG